MNLNKSNKNCAFVGCKNNSLRTPPEITYHKFAKPCQKVARGKEEATESHLKSCSACTKCQRWVTIGQGTKKWPTSMTEVKTSHYVCSLHFVNGHPYSERFPDPLPALAALSLRDELISSTQNKRKQTAFQADIDSAKRKKLLPKSVPPSHTAVSGDSGGQTGIVRLPFVFEACERPQTSLLSPKIENFESPDQPDIVRLPFVFGACETTKTILLSPKKENFEPPDQTDIVRLPLEFGACETPKASLLSPKKEKFKLPSLAKTLRSSGTTTRSQQTTAVWNDFAKLKDENRQLVLENIALKKRIQELEEERNVERNKGGENFMLFAKSLEKDEKKCKFYTNLTFVQILALFNVLSSKDLVECSTKRSHTKLEELILVLVRLRTGLLTQDLVYRFGMSQGFISKKFVTWIQHAYCKFDKIRPLMFPPKHMIEKNLPAEFSKIKNVRVIIDCAEFYCQTPSNMDHSGDVNSSHEGSATFKVLLGCTPNGAVSFVSDLFDGSISDEELVEQSKLLDHLDEDDIVLADRGFARTELKDEKNVKLKTLPCLKGHVVGKLKQFKLLSKALPLNMRGILPQVVFVCACLINYQQPTFK